MNRKKLFGTILLSGMAFAINYLINFFLTSFVTGNIGTDAYGFVSLAKTFASYALIVSSALNSYSSRYIAIEYYKKNYERANTYFNSVLFADMFFGAVLVVGGIIVVNIAENALNIPMAMATDIKLLFILVFLNMFISLSGTAFQAAAIIKNRLMLISIAKACSYLAEAIILLVIFSVFPAKVYFVGIGIIVATMLMVSVNFAVGKSSTPELIIKFRYFEIGAVKELVSNGIWNSLNSLGNTLNSGLDLLISNVLLSAVTMGQVSIVKSIVNIFNSLYQMVAQPFEPVFLNDYAYEDNKRLIHHLKFSMKVSGLFSNLAFAGTVAYGACYYNLWIPAQNCELLYKFTIIAVTTSLFEGVVYPLYYIYTLTMKNRIPCIITIAGGLLNVSGMFLLIRYTDFGAYAVFLTTAFIMILINGITNPVYMSYCLGLPWYSFYPEIFRHLVSCFFMTLILKVLSMVFLPNSWMTLAGAAFVSCIIGAFIHVFIVFRAKELKEFLIYVRKILECNHK